MTTNVPKIGESIEAFKEAIIPTVSLRSNNPSGNTRASIEGGSFCGGFKRLTGGNAAMSGKTNNISYNIKGRTEAGTLTTIRTGTQITSHSLNLDVDISNYVSIFIAISGEIQYGSYAVSNVLMSN